MAPAAPAHGCIQWLFLRRAGQRAVTRFVTARVTFNAVNPAS
jgi:hypothetical protein